MKTKFWVSALALLTVFTSFTQTEFTCDGQKFDVKGYEFLDVDYPEESRITHYYWKKVGDKISIKSYLLIDGTIDRWMSYTISKNYFKDIDRKNFLTSFPPIEEDGDESNVMNYSITIEKDYSTDILYSQYWCGWETSLMYDYEHGNIDFTFSTKAATEKFLGFFGK